METLINTQIKNLINKAFDLDGTLSNPNSASNKKEAQRILDLEVVKSTQMLDGFSVYTSLLIIANPNQDI